MQEESNSMAALPVLSTSSTHGMNSRNAQTKDAGYFQHHDQKQIVSLHGAESVCGAERGAAVPQSLQHASYHTLKSYLTLFTNSHHQIKPAT